MFQEGKKESQVPPVPELPDEPDEAEIDWTGRQRPGNGEEPPTSVNPPDEDGEHTES